MKTKQALAICLVGAGIYGCALQPAAPVSTSAQLPVSLNQVIVALIGYGSNPLWVAAWKAPATDDDWFTLERATTQLELGSELISIPGTGPLDATWTANPDWQLYSVQLRQEVSFLRGAVNRRDTVALSQVADRMSVVCDACHEQFKPVFPTGGRSGKISREAQGF